MIGEMSPESQHWPDAPIAMAQDAEAGGMDDGSADDDDMRTVARGDWQAFSRLVSRHHRMAWRVAVGILNDQADADDVAQEAFLKLRDAAPRYVPAGKFRPFLYQIVTRLCLDRLRKRRTCSLSEVAELSSNAPDLVETLHQQERDRLVREAIASLPMNQRIAVVLKYFEGCGYRDIAATLRISGKAAERLLARARQSLEGRLASKISGKP